MYYLLAGDERGIIKNRKESCVCGSVYERGKSRRSKVTAVKKKSKLKRQEKRSPVTDKKKQKKYKVGAENRVGRASLIVSPMAILTDWLANAN